MGVCSIVLAAGRGERLWPLTSTRPKPLLPLPGDGTILARTLRQLRRLVDTAIIVVGHLGWMIKSYVNDYLGLSGWARFAEQDEQLGTGHAVSTALSHVPRGCDVVVIVYADLLLGDQVIKVLSSCISDGVNCVIGVEHEEPWNYGVLFAKGDLLERIVEKPRPELVPGNALINAGVYVIDRVLLEEACKDIPLSPRGEYELTDVVNHVASKSRVHVKPLRDVWMDIGRPWDLLKASAIIVEGLLAGKQVVEGEVEPGAIVKGPVYIGPNAVIRAGSVVEGPAWIEGEVGPLAHVRPYTYTLPGSKIGAFSQVKASIIMEAAKVPHLNYVGDSIIGEAVNLGAGTITANLRFDHRTIKVRLKGKLVDSGRRKLGVIMGGYSQTGVNVSTLPGTRIGAWSWIYPGLVVGGDIPDCVLAKPSATGLEFEDLARRGQECSVKEPPWLLARRAKK